MEFFAVLDARHSIRAFAPTPVDKDKLDAILAAANGAPSALNAQSYEIYIAQGREQAAAIAAATWNQTFVGQAPVVLIFCSNPARSEDQLGAEGARTFALQDAAIACTFAMLAATAQSLATVWVGAFDPAAIARLIGAPAGVVPVAILPVGYAAQPHEPTTRRTLSDLVHAISPTPSTPGS